MLGTVIKLLVRVGNFGTLLLALLNRVSKCVVGRCNEMWLLGIVVITSVKSFWSNLDFQVGPLGKNKGNDDLLVTFCQLSAFILLLGIFTNEISLMFSWVEPVFVLMRATIQVFAT